MPAGSDVLIFGMGALGLAVVVWARALGTRYVVVVARSDRNAEMAIRLGATEFVWSDADSGKAFAELSDGPPQIVFECVGAKDILNECMNLSAPRGQVISMGDCRHPRILETTPAHFRELDIWFSLEYSVQDYQAVVDLSAQGKIDPDVMITNEVWFDQFAPALEALRHPTTQCKVLLAPEWLTLFDQSRSHRKTRRESCTKL